MLIPLLLLNFVGRNLAVPARGNYPWTILLCKFQEIDWEPKPRTYYENWLLNEQEDGTLSNFFNTVSNGVYRIDTASSSVVGWFTLPYRKDDVRRMAENDAFLQNTYQNAAYQRMYHKIKELCIETVETYWSVRIPDRHRSPNIITVINDENVAIYCGPGVGILITPPAMLTSALSHEMVHSLNIGHSYSDRKVKVYPQAAVGEYDDKYDLMSTANAFMFRTQYGQTGPGLIGPHLDYLGWLPAHRIFYFGKHSPSDMREIRVKLSTLSLPHKKTWNYLLAVIPYDRDDPQLVYTVEYRTRTGVDSGIPYNGVVLIHQIVNRSGYFYTQLITETWFKNEFNQGEQFYRIYEHVQGAFLHITINRVNKDEAEIQIHCTFEPTQCIDTEVRRAAFTGDNVCVSAAEFTEVANDLSRQRERRDSSGKGCLPGYADLFNNICLTEVERRSLDEQNRRSEKYANFFKFESWGLNACRAPWIWRQIDAYDFVCVTETERWAAEQQTLKAANNTAADGRCKAGFILRGAFYGDQVCVTAAERDAALQQNFGSGFKLLYRRFFNGIDELQQPHQKQEQNT